MKFCFNGIALRYSHLNKALGSWAAWKNVSSFYFRMSRDTGTSLWNGSHYYGAKCYSKLWRSW